MMKNYVSDDVGMYDRTLASCSGDKQWDENESKCYIKMNKGMLSMMKNMLVNTMIVMM